MARGKKKNETAKAVEEKKVVETPVAEEVKAEAAPVVEEKPETKAAEKKTEAKKPVAKKTAAPKAAASKTAAAPKAPAAKKTAEEKRVFIQFAGNQVLGADLVERAKTESGIKNPKKIDIYVKPEDNKVYYVIDDNAGDFDLF